MTRTASAGAETGEAWLDEKSAFISFQGINVGPGHGMLMSGCLKGGCYGLRTYAAIVASEFVFLENHLIAIQLQRRGGIWSFG